MPLWPNTARLILALSALAACWMLLDREDGTSALLATDRAVGVPEAGPILVGTPTPERSGSPGARTPVPDQAGDVEVDGSAVPALTMLVGGRLLGPDGTPVRRGSVAIHTLLLDVHSADAVPRHEVTGADGRFEQVCAWGERLEILAWADSMPPLRLTRAVTPGETVQLGDLMLERGASLNGRVLVGGKPSPFGSVSVLVRRLDTMTQRFFHAAPRRAFTADADDPGTAYVLCLADDSGAWAADGLSPGRYEVSVREVGNIPLHDGLRSQSMRIAEPPTEELLFDLAACRLDLTAATLRAPDPHEPILLRWNVTDREGRTTSRACVSHRGWRGPDASDLGWPLLVPASSEVDVWAVAHLCAPWRKTVSTAGARETQSVAPDFAPAQFGRLAVRVPDGAPRGDLKLLLRLLEPDTRHLVFWQHVEDDTLQAEVPTGTWDAELHPEGLRANQPSRFYLPQRTRVTVEAERTTRLQWRPPLGARLRIQTAQAGTGYVRCTLIRTTGTQDAAEFLPVSAQIIAYAPGTYPESGPLVAGGLHELMRALEPGAVTVRLECRGCATFEERLVLEAGVVHDLLAKLEPR